MEILPISLQARDLAKRFRRDWIFRKFDDVFEPGSTYAVTGPNGSGKSTLLQVLWAQSPPTRGSVEYTSPEQAISADDIFRHIAIATPYMDLIEEFTLVEQIEFHFRLKPLREGIQKEEIPGLMNLEGARQKQLRFFSSGMRQRVKLALAFYTSASLLFLDEPGTNLDRPGFNWFQDELSRISGPTTIFIASNNPEEYVSATRRINILDYK